MRSGNSVRIVPVGAPTRICRVLIAAAAAFALGSVAAARAETPANFCARVGTDDTLRPIPESLVPAVNSVFGTDLPVRTAMDTTVFRCVDRHLLVCTVGANLPCGLANASRTPSAAMSQWCRDHRDDMVIPAVVTGHETIYAWRCLDGAPQVVRQIGQVDPRGFVAQYWKALQ
jgi:hypothetical protein